MCIWGGGNKKNGENNVSAFRFLELCKPEEGKRVFTEGNCRTAGSEPSAVALSKVLILSSLLKRCRQSPPQQKPMKTQMLFLSPHNRDAAQDREDRCRTIAEIGYIVLCPGVAVCQPSEHECCLIDLWFLHQAVTNHSPLGPLHYSPVLLIEDFHFFFIQRSRSTVASLRDKNE